MAEDIKPHIGKRVIETLTLGMYDDARFVYREYVQNAADQIDVAFETGILSSKSEGKILINIDTVNKQITVKDNATGIAGKDVTRFLGDIANSQKDRDKRKGFRGIGRLGGLGYCDKLIFETSAHNESFKTIMSLDAKMLRDIIEDSSNESEASSVISVITSISKEPERMEDHYFTITLENVSDKLLDVESVRNYLAMVAPLPFATEFKCNEEINTHFKKNNSALDDYYVEINKKQLFKSYKDQFIDENGTSELLGVKFFEVRDDNLELLAIGWFGFRNLANFVLSPSNKERGIRLRKNNIGIGDEFTLARFFDAERTNLRFIGELHVFGSSFIPNARRDYFIENKTLQTFEKKLTDMFLEQNWENRVAQAASQLHNRVKEVREYQAKNQQYEAMKGSFKSEADQNEKFEELRKAEQKAKDAIKIITRFKKKKAEDDTLEKLYDNIIADQDLSIPNTDDVVLEEFEPPTFKKLKKNEQELVRDIFTILEKNLKPAEAKKIKQLIFDKYN